MAVWSIRWYLPFKLPQAISIPARPYITTSGPPCTSGLNSNSTNLLSGLDKSLYLSDPPSPRNAGSYSGARVLHICFHVNVLRECAHKCPQILKRIQPPNREESHTFSKSGFRHSHSPISDSPWVRLSVGIEVEDCIGPGGNRWTATCDRCWNIGR